MRLNQDQDQRRRIAELAIDAFLADLKFKKIRIVDDKNPLLIGSRVADSMEYAMKYVAEASEHKPYSRWRRLLGLGVINTRGLS